MRTRLTIMALMCGILWANSVFAHHSNVGFEVTKVLTITGTVKDLRWANPHIWVDILVDDGKGGKAEWSLEGRPPGILIRSGWTRNALKAGDTVTIDYSPAKDGSKTGLIARVTRGDGTVLENAPPQN